MTDDNILGFPHGFRGTDSGSVEPQDYPNEGYALQHLDLPAPNDPVKHPAHYNRNAIETWDIIEHVIEKYPDPTAAYHVASCLKYFDRCCFKGNFYQDLRKGIEHAKRLEKHLDRLGV